MTRVKKVLHDKLITDMRALKYYNNETCFAEVQKMYIAFPTGFPFGQVYAIEPEVEVMGLDYDERTYKFALVIGDLLNKDDSQTVIDLKIDRMSDLEDSILDYIESIPNKLSGLAEGVKPLKVRIVSARLDEEDSEDGIRRYLVIEIALTMSIAVKELV